MISNKFYMKERLSIFLIATIMTSYFSCAISSSFNDNGLQDSPWPMFCHDVMHTGRSGYDTSMVTGEEIWRYRMGSVISSPAIDKDGTIYVGSGSSLYAINSDGRLKWRFKTGGGVSSSPAIAKDGTIYVGSNDGKLYAIYPNGTLKWQFSVTPRNWVSSSPAIGKDGTIYVGSTDYFIYAINPDGTLKWKFETGSKIYSSPAIGNDGTIYIGSHDSYLYAINPDGTLKWKFKAKAEVRGSPAIGNDGTIYVGCWSDYLYAINPDGTLKWKFKVKGPWEWCGMQEAPAIGEDGTIYVGTYYGMGNAGCLYAINPDGTEKWHIETGTIYGSPSIGKDGTIYVGTAEGIGKLYAVNPDGTIKWVWKALSEQEYHYCHIDSSPAIGKDGTIYIGSWFGSEKGSWGYLHAIRDGMPKGVEIVRPKQDYLYIFDREIMKIKDTTIIGWITIKPEIISEKNVKKVEFYVNYKLKHTDYSPPFEWKWNERIVGKSLKYLFETRGISVKAYYNDGDVVASKIKTVAIFNPFGKIQNPP